MIIVNSPVAFSFESGNELHNYLKWTCIWHTFGTRKMDIHSSIHSIRIYWAPVICSTIFVNKFNWRILWWLLPYINMNRPQVYMRPLQPEPPSHVPPHTTPWGCPRAPVLGALLSTSTCTGHPFTYGNVHVSVLFSRIIPPSPSPTESKSLFFTSVSPLCAAPF